MGNPVFTGSESPLWGKWGTTGRAYPLVAHLLDTAACSLAVSTIYLSQRLKQRIGCITSAGDSDVALAVLSALHDCGKSEPQFQGQQANRDAKRFSENLTSLEALGLPGLTQSEVSAISTDPEFRRLTRHESISGHILHDSGYPVWASAAVAGHHGRYQMFTGSNRTVDGKAKRFISATAVGAAWAEPQSVLVSSVVTAVTGGGDVRWASEIQGAVIPFLTGLICIADWMASDGDFIQTAPLELLNNGGPVDLRNYFLHRETEARAHIERNLGVIPQLPGSFEDLFGFSPKDRAVQNWAVNDLADHDGLTIVTVPMGEGKTETALWMHRSSSLKDGILFGLPTMATSDAMFARIQRAFKGTPALANLAHGRAILNAFYDPSEAIPLNVCDEDGGLESGRWFKDGPHRALLAPVTVGTCDQVLAAGLSHKFLPVRLAALASKHVVLDEVHTYDPYQDQLLLRLLGWLGSMGTRVTLLTATLPRQRRNAYLKAYADGGYGTGSLDSATIPDGYPAVYWIRPEEETARVHMKEMPSWRSYDHAATVIPVDGNPGTFAQQSAHIVLDLSAAHPTARIGVIVNTVDRAIDITRLIEATETARNRECLLLHSRMTAGERFRRTDRLLSELGSYATSNAGDVTGGGGRSITVIATQIAEASFDVDFDFLITDLCPMPSLLQRMGRQWRHSSISDEGTWNHDRNPTVAELRGGLSGPEVIVIYPSGPDGNGLHPRGHFPYTRAEVTAAHDIGLAGISSIDMPGDLQGLVDRCHVDLTSAALMDGAEAGIDDEITAHLTEVLQKQRAADSLGIAQEKVTEEWVDIQNPEVDEAAWFGSLQLDALTTGQIWGDHEVQTRLTDSISLTVLPFSEHISHPFAWNRNPEHVVLGRFDSSQARTATIREAIAGTVTVSGALARVLLAIPVSGAWVEGAPPLLRSTVPVSVETLERLGMTLDSYGLHKVDS